MSDSLVQRIGYRLKFVDNPVDHRLLLEARDVLAGMSPTPQAKAVEAGPHFKVPWDRGNETRAEAFTRATGINLLFWQKKKLNEADL